MKIVKDYIVMRQSDDWHTHPREDELMEKVIGLFNIYGRVVCMGNLTDPVDNLQKYITYWNNLVKKGRFQPIIGVMLTKNMTVDKLATLLNIFYGQFFLKYMPEGVTTNSEHGIPWAELKNFYPVLRLAEHRRIPIMLHAEADKDPITGEPIDEIDREKAAIPYVAELARTFPKAIINVEHVSTAAMCELIRRHDNLSGSISVNHLIHRYEDVRDGQGRIINVHKYCKPIAKKDYDRKAVIAAALSGSKKFFFGSDNAPHLKTNKETFQRAGNFNALTNLAYLAEFFETHEALDERFEDFVSSNGAARYNFPLNTGTIKLIKKYWTVPAIYHGIVPDLAGRTMRWQVVT